MKIKAAYIAPSILILFSVVLFLALFSYIFASLELKKNTENRPDLFAEEQVEEYQPFDLEELSALSSSPVFMPSRQMPEAESEEVAPPQDTPVPNLVGVMRIDGIRKALFTIDGVEGGYWVTQGDALREWEVKEVKTDSVEIFSAKHGSVMISILRNATAPTKPNNVIPPKVINMANVNGGDAQKTAAELEKNLRNAERQQRGNRNRQQENQRRAQGNNPPAERVNAGPNETIQIINQ